ncbi:ATP-dependent Clp protease ATP-binding subunit [Candidatus Saccharibacteria bacterium]|nr:ATP-dependent Clp protease ATP-binding subunit [Candidatus Saccharibacteria bacterium]
MQEEFSEIMSRLSENARFALQKSDFYAKRYNNGYMGTEHLLMGILAMDTSTGATMLRNAGATIDDVEKSLNKVAVEVAAPSDMAMMSLSEAVILTFRMAQNYIKEQGLSVIGTEHILYALLSQPNSRASLILTGLEVDTEKLLNEIDTLVERQTQDEKAEAEKAKYIKKSGFKYLKKYGKDLTDEAREGRLDTVIGRENEIERVVTVLSRRTKSNPVLIGEAGVGKTAIVEGLAMRIVKNEVPGNLIGKHIYQVDLSGLVAGTKFRGEFEERIKGVIDEATSDDTVLLFIDEIHLLCGAGSSEGSMDAANILKPALARNTINLIGATTLDEYRKTIEKDKALSRRFQTVMVEEPSNAVTLRILKGIKKHYEKHHGVIIPDEMLETAITMSQRYINDRFMPDKVIDIIDEASAICKVAADKKGGSKYKKLKIERTTLEEKITTAAEAEDFEKAANYKTELARLEKEIKKLEKTGVKKEVNPKLTEENLATAVSLKTGIPVSKVHGSEMKMLLSLEDELKKSVIGQDDAVKAVAKAIRRGRSGITDSRRPIGSFLFMGPTGVGKTELARVIAREVFGGENALVKIDMSEFGEKHNVSRLVGAPAGYIGYDDGGKLTEAVRRKPYSVILFDEIEKAHPDVFNLLLQILEDGVLTDGQGNKIKFNNTIVILTSNLGSADMFRESELGFTAKTAKDKKALAQEYEENKEYAMKALRKIMRPELINRLDDIEVFHALTRKDVERIFDNLIEDLIKRLATKGIGIRVDEKAKKYLIDNGYDPKNGARPLRRCIEDKVESLLSEAIIAEEFKKGDIPLVTLEKGKIVLKKEK